MPACNRFTVKKLRERRTNDAALVKYANAGKIFSDATNKSDDYYIDYLIDLIDNWTNTMKIPRLRDVGVLPEHFKKIVDVADNKNNPVALEKDEMMEVLEESS